MYFSAYYSLIIMNWVAKTGMFEYLTHSSLSSLHREFRSMEILLCIESCLVLSSRRKKIVNDIDKISMMFFCQLLAFLTTLPFRISASFIWT